MENEAMKHNKPADDKIHSMFNKVEKSTNELSYDAEQNSYELDKDSEDPEYDHPLPYDTVAQGGIDDNSTYDEANPYVGDEYEPMDQRDNMGLDDPAIRIDNNANFLKLSKQDEMLSKTEEDNRDDLDEEGYPKNNVKKKF